MSLIIDKRNVVQCSNCFVREPCTVVDAIGFAATYVQLTEITPNNWQEWYLRALVFHWAANAGYSNTEKPFNLVPQDFFNHVGLKVTWELIGFQLVDKNRHQFMTLVKKTLFAAAETALKDYTNVHN